MGHQLGRDAGSGIEGFEEYSNPQLYDNTAEKMKGLPSGQQMHIPSQVEKNNLPERWLSAQEILKCDHQNSYFFSPVYWEDQKPPQCRNIQCIEERKGTNP